MLQLTFNPWFTLTGFRTARPLCLLRLLKLKTEGQTMQTEKVNDKLQT